MCVDPWVRKIPWRRKWQPTLIFLSRESHGQRSLESHSPWGGKELDMTEPLSMYVEHRKHYSILCNDLYGKRILKRVDICIYVTDSLCWKAEVNTTL